MLPWSRYLHDLSSKAPIIVAQHPARDILLRSAPNQQNGFWDHRYPYRRRHFWAMRRHEQKRGRRVADVPSLHSLFFDEEPAPRNYELCQKETRKSSEVRGTSPATRQATYFLIF